jgi:archaemetzincin
MTRGSRGLLVLISAVCLLLVGGPPGSGDEDRGTLIPPNTFGADLEVRLKPLAERLGKPRSGEWRFEHPEEGPQSFDEYVYLKPVRKSGELHTIYLCLLGDFSEAQQKVVDINREYLEIFFQTPVKILHRVPLAKIPASARRKNPQEGHPQILTKFVLKDLLESQRPPDALAYVAFTPTDLWTRDQGGQDWNFVFGEASLRERVGVWSLARYPDPARDLASFQSCLKHTLGTASHEISHILTMLHCTEYNCSMNGSNHLVEAESKPLHVCPPCFRKLAWNLQLDPVEYCRKLEDFSRRHGFPEEATYYGRAAEAL